MDIFIIYIIFNLLIISVYTSEEYAVCNYSLGMTNFDIEDYQLSSSEVMFIGNTFYSPADARKDSIYFGSDYKIGYEENLFVFKKSPGDWLQIDLLVTHEVTGMALQGGKIYYPYIKTLYVEYCEDMLSWKWYEDGQGNKKLFTNDVSWSHLKPETTTKYLEISPSIKGRGIRIHAQSHQSYPDLRMELYGCTQTPSRYTKYQNTDIGITTSSANNGATAHISFDHTYAITALILQTSNLNGNSYNVNTTIIVSYKKFDADIWRNVLIYNHDILGSQITLNFGLAVKAMQLKVTCDTNVLNCNDAQVIYGKKLSGCPVGFVESEGYCYSHYIYTQTLKDEKQKAMCQRMSWGNDGVYMAFPHEYTISDLYFFRETSYRSDPKTMHFGLFRDGNDKPWYTQGGRKIVSIDWGYSTTNEFCTKLENRLQTEYCYNARPFTCQTKVQGKSEHPNCVFISTNRDKALVTSDKVIMPGRQITECMYDCQTRTDFKCLSIEWNEDSNECRLNKVHSDTIGVTQKSESKTDLFDYYCLGDCQEPLLFFKNGTNQSDVILSAEATASKASVLDIRMENLEFSDGGAYWYPDCTACKWFQVEWTGGKVAKIQKMIMMGGTYSYNGFIKKFVIYYSNSTTGTIGWNVYKDGATGLNKEFSALTDRYDIKQYVFTPPIVAKYFRIYVTSYYYRKALNMELYGCVFEEEPFYYNSLGMDNYQQHDIENNQLTAAHIHVNGYGYYTPWQGRILNNPKSHVGKEYHFWAGYGYPGTWYQVDFLTPHDLFGFAENKGWNGARTTVYRVKYSLTSPITMDSLLDDNGNAQELSGNIYNDYTIYNGFNGAPIKARYLQIINMVLSTQPQQRFEFYGFPSMSDCPELNSSDMTTVDTSPSNGCACSLPTAANSHITCLHNTLTTITLQFNSMYLLHGFDLVWESAPSNSCLNTLQVEYFHSGNTTWSTMYHIMNQENTTRTVFKAKRLCRATKFKVKFPPAAASNCVTLRILGYPAQPCPPGFVQYHRKCLQLPEGEMQLWDTTKKDFAWEQIGFCSRMTWNGKANMGSVSNIEEQSLIYGLNNRASNHLWDGLWAPNISIKNPFEWEWMDGNPSTWTLWYPGEPHEVTSLPYQDRCAANYRHVMGRFDNFCSIFYRYWCNIDILVAENETLVNKEWSVLLKYREASYLSDFVIGGHTLSYCLSFCESQVIPNCSAVLYHHVAKAQKCYLSTKTIQSGTFVTDGAFDFYQLHSWDDDCMNPLVWPNYPGQVEVTATSNKEPKYNVMHADLNSLQSYWRPYDNNGIINQFIHVDFHGIARVNKISIGNLNGCWVKQFVLLYTNDTRWWSSYTDSQGNTKIFVGNELAKFVNKIFLTPPIIARFVRIYPTSWHYHICLKFELYGCLIAKDGRNFCNVLSRSAARYDYNGHRFSYIEVDGHPYINEQTASSPTFRGIHMLTLDEETCHADLVSRHDLLADPTNRNQIFRNRLKLFENGTHLFGISNDYGEYVNAETETLLTSMGLGTMAKNLKAVLYTSNAFYTKIGDSTSVKLEWTPRGLGPPFLLKQIQERIPNDYSVSSKVLPTALGYWPFSVNIQDTSGNNLHFETITGNEVISKDQGTWNHGHASFDGSSSLRTEVNNTLLLSGDFTVFLAVYPNNACPLITFHDDITSNYQTYFSIWLQNVGKKIILKRGSSDTVLDAADRTVQNAWNFIAFSFDSKTKIMRFWKNGRVHYDTLVNGDFSSATGRRYITVGADGTSFLKGKLSCLQFYDKKLTTLYINKIIQNCRGQKDLFEGLKNVHNEYPDEIQGPLGMMDGTITESQTKLSSIKPESNKFHKDNTRLYAYSKGGTDTGCWKGIYWGPGKKEEWFQIDLGMLHKITGIVTKGCPTTECYTKHLLIEYANEDYMWNTIMANTETENKTVYANGRWNLARQSALPYPVYGRHLRLWLHTTTCNNGQFEVIGRPIDLPSLTVTEIMKIGIKSSSICPKYIVAEKLIDIYSDYLNCDVCVLQNIDIWWEYDFTEMFSITSLVVSYKNTSENSELKMGFQKRYASSSKWDYLSEIPPVIQTKINGSIFSSTFLMIPVLHTRYLKMTLLSGNLTCFIINIHGQKATVCPPGSIFHNKKCLTMNHKKNAIDNYVLSNSEKACKFFSWASPGRTVQPKQEDTAQLMKYLMYSHDTSVKITQLKIGLNHSGSMQTTSWIDGSTANGQRWTSGYPSATSCNAYLHESITYKDNGASEVAVPFVCETMSSVWDPSSEGHQMTITAQSTYAVYVDGTFKGKRDWWNYPWIINLHKETKVIAVEMTLASILYTPGLLVYINDGTVSDSTWKCSTTLENYWTDVDFNDTHWQNATEIEPHSTSSRVLQYGFENVNKDPFWIWTKNYNILKDMQVYCRKVLNVLNRTSGTSSHCNRKWGFLSGMCVPSINDTIIHADSAIDCMSKCEANTSCGSLDYYTDKSPSCYLRSQTRAGLPNRVFTATANCYFFDTWCSDCSTFLINDLYSKGLVQLEASTENSPASQGILNGFNMNTRAYLKWYTTTVDAYQWIKATFTDYVNITAITTSSHGYIMSKYYVFYVDAVTNSFRDVRDVDGNRREFLAHNFLTTMHSTNVLSKPVVTKIILINPKQWNTFISVNFDVQGCVLKSPNEESEYWKLGMTSGDIGISQITATNTYDTTYTPHQARLLNKPDLPNTNGCWRPREQPYELMVDLLINHYVQSVHFQSCSGVIHFITSIALRYGSDGKVWQKLFNDDGVTERVFDGSYFNGDFTGVVDIPNGPIVARYVQIVILSFDGSYPGLRLEIYGKPIECDRIYFPVISITGSEGITNNEASKTSRQNEIVPSADAWCPNLVLLTSYEKPTVTIQLDALYLVTSLEFFNSTGIVDINVWYSSDGGASLREYNDEKRNTSVLNVENKQVFSFQRLLKLKNIQIKIVTWKNTQPCLQLSLHACKASVCPPNTIEHGDNCYYKDDLTKGSYNYLSSNCDSLDWSGKGYPVMPKDWKEFDFVQAITNPDRRNLTRYYLGLGLNGGTFQWADNETVIDSNALPFTSTPSLQCVQYGETIDRFTSVTCNTQLKLVCQVKSSGSPTDSTTLWLHRWNILISDVTISFSSINTVIDCMRICMYNSSITCKSILYSRTTKVCQINENTMANSSGENVFSDQDWIYFEPHLKEPCEVNLMPDATSISSISASSTYDGNHASVNAIYNPAYLSMPMKYWRASDSALVNQWVKVIFSENVLVKRILIAGAVTDAYWASEVTILSSHNGEWFQHYYSNPANISHDIITYGTSLTQMLMADTPLLYPLLAQSIQITLKTYIGKPVLRLAVYGCRVGNGFRQACFGGLGLQQRLLKPSQFSSSSAKVTSDGKWYGPFNAGLDAVDDKNDMAGWIPHPSTDTASSFLQVDLELAHKITYIVTQGIGTNYVTSFDLHYSNDNNVWITTRVDNTTMNYPGSLMKILHRLSPSITTKSIRIYPRAYSGEISLRLEIVGCPLECATLSVPIFSNNHLPTDQCVYNSSSSCKTWCPKDDGSLEMNLTFDQQYYITGFTLQSVNSTYTSDYQVNISNNEIFYHNWHEGSQVVLDMDKFINTTGSRWRWSLLYPTIMRDMQINVSLSDTSQCLHIEIYACNLGACPSGFTQYKDQCYYFRDEPYNSLYNGSSHNDGMSLCNDISWGNVGHLAIPKNTEENYFLQSMASSETATFFIGVKYNSSTTTFDDISSNSAIAFSHWDKDGGHPNPPAGNCVNMNSGFWESSSCDSTNVLCQTKAQGSFSEDEVQWVIIKNVEVQGVSHVKEDNIVHISACLQICEQFSSCKSVEYNTTSRQCKLFEKNRYISPLILLSGTNLYFEKLITSSCNEDILDILKYTTSSSSDLDGLHMASMIDMDKSSSSAAGGYWQPFTNDNSQWIQITFEKLILLSRLVVIGSDFKVSNSQITQFNFHSSVDTISWLSLTNDIDGSKLFQTYTGNHGLSQFTFSSKPLGIAFKLVPLAWETDIALKLKLYGCLEPDVLKFSCATVDNPRIGHRDLLSPKLLECYNDWNIILNHNKGSSYFNTTWQNYRLGFEYPNNTEYFIGNDILHSIQNNMEFSLRFDMWINDTDFIYAEFQSFSVKSASYKYAVTLQNFIRGNSGTGGLLSLSGSEFTIGGNDATCFVESSGGFWHGNMNYCSNSLFTSYPDIWWKSEISNTTIQLEKVVMRMKPHLHLVNVAFGKTTFQSSTSLPTYGSLKAIDGYAITDTTKGSCAVTNMQKDPFWIVDLGKLFHIRSVEITSSVDSLLHDFDVKISMTEENFTNPDFTAYTLCSHYSGIMDLGITQQINCTDIIFGQYVAVQMPGLSEKLTICELDVNIIEKKVNLGETCGWDIDCMTEFSQCLPENISSKMLNFTCQCQPHYISDQGICKPSVDITLEVNATESSNVLVRGIHTNVSISVDIINLDPRDILPQYNENNNFELNISISDQDINMGSPTQQLTGFPYFYTKGTPKLGVSASRSVNVVLQYEIYFTPAQCSLVKYLCLDITRSNNASYFERNLSNSMKCVDITNITICKPGADISLESVVITGGNTIIRDTPKQYPFQLSLAFVSGKYPVVPVLDNNVNFAVWYMLSTKLHTNGSMFASTIGNNELSLSNVSIQDVQRQLSTDHPLTFHVTSMLGFDFNICNVTDYVCFVVTDDTTSTYAETDFSNNMYCIDISLHKVCNPEILVSLDNLVLTMLTPIVRGYNTSVTLKFQLFNEESFLPIPSILDPHLNFNVSVYMADKNLQNTQSTIFMVESFQFSQSQLQQGIPPNGSVPMEGKALLLIPRIICEKLVYMCIEITPWQVTTYQLYAGQQHIRCMNSSADVNCPGISLRNVSFSATKLVVAVNENIDFSVSWSQGTDLHYKVDLDDGLTYYSWNWQIAGHISNFGPLSTNFSHIYSEIGNFTAQLRIWNNVTEELRNVSIVVEPYLESYINFSTKYIPKYVPLNVEFEVNQMHPWLKVPIWMNCIIDYEDSGVQIETYEIIVYEKHIFSHTFINDAPDAVSLIRCNNHVSNVSYRSMVILRQEISGLNITMEQPTYPTGDNARFLISMNSGSHVILTISFGDGSIGVFTKTDIHSSNFTWNVEHLYSLHGNYSVSLVASNEHFNDSAALYEKVIIQNPVPQIVLTSSSSSVQVPTGQVYFSVVPLSTSIFPDNVFCEWQWTNDTLEFSYSTALMKGESDTKLHIYERKHIGFPLNVSVTCKNLVSRHTGFTSIQVYEKIEGLDVAVNPRFVHPNQNFSLSMSLLNGSNVFYEINFSDGVVKIVPHGNVFAVTSVTYDQYLYPSIGNYSLNITAFNAVSNMSYPSELVVVVQNPIVNLSLSANNSVLWPSGSVDFEIFTGVNQLPLNNIHFKWIYTASLIENTFTDIFPISELLGHTYTFPRSSVGLANITVNCSNLISWKSINTSVEIILDEVILDALVTDEWLWWTNTSIFNMTIVRFGTYSCFEWDMGDGNKALYGVPWCQTYATENGLELIPVEHGITHILKNYTYEHWGNYHVKVFAFNHITNDTAETVTVIKDWYCYFPNITFSTTFTDSTKLQRFMKSTDFTLAPTNISIDCMKSLNKSISVFNIYSKGDFISNSILSLQNETSFHHTKRLLSYGSYVGSLKLEMLGVPEVYKIEEIYFEIVKTPLDINIKGSGNISINFNEIMELDAETESFDHDVDPFGLQNLAFEWSCKQQNEVFPRDNNGNILHAGTPFPGETSFDTFKGCFGGGPGKLPENKGKWHVNTGDMMPNKVYVFRATASKDTRIGSADIFVFITPPIAPNITVKCVENCGPRRSQTSAIILKADCSNHCQTKFGIAKHIWVLEWTNETNGLISQYTNWNAITAEGNTGDTLHTNPSTLTGGVYHTAIVTSSTPGSYKSVVRYRFLVNLPPYGGSCGVEPLTGFAAKTFFEFTCVGWKEWRGNGNNNLKFEYRVRSLGSERSFLVYYGTSMTSDPANLPMGNYQIDFKNEMELFIFDSVGDYYKLLLNVTVYPETRPKLDVTNDMEQEITSSESNLTKAFNSSNYQVVSSTIYAMASLINLPVNFDVGINVTEDIQLVRNVRKSVRAKCIDMISQIPVTSSDGLLQTNEVLRSTLLIPDEIVVDAQGSAINKVDSMTNFFLETRANVTKTIYKQITVDLATAGVLVLTAANFTMKELSTPVYADSNITTTYAPITNEQVNASDVVKEKVKNVMKSVVSTIKKVTGTMLTDKQVGEPDDIIDLYDVTLMIGKNNGTKISNASFTSRQGTVNLPELQQVLPGSSGDCVGNNIMFSAINPFIYGPDISAENVNSAIVDFTLEDCSDSNKRVKRSTNTEYEVELTASSTGDPVFVNENITDVNGMIYHSINISSQPYNPVTVSVYPVGNQSLKVYLNIDTKPTPSQYMAVYISPHSNETHKVGDKYELQHSFYISPENLTTHNASKVFIGVKTNGCLPDRYCDPQALASNEIAYSYRLSEIMCQTWDSTLQIWTNGGCQVLEGSSPAKVKFKSNLFGSMGAGVFVGPNTIDFGTVFNNLDQKLAENAAVVGTIAAVIILYIPLVILCRLFDKKDKLKWLILPLVDNHPEDEYCYEVHIYTGLKSNAETDSNVSMVLAGTDSDTGTRPLKDGQRKNFQRGDVTSFLMKTTHHLGIPVALKIWHDNSGNKSKASWYLSKVIIVDLKKNKWYLFMCEDWLGMEESDGQCERLIKLASSDELAADSGSLLQNNIKKKLFDDHIWVSLGYRKTRSSFTRVQRLSCCLAILFLTMVSNAMWFGTGNTESSQVAFSIGPISFTVHQLYTSLMSSLIIVPPIILITVFFTKCKEKTVKVDNLSAMDRQQLKTAKKLPHWCIYIAYVLVILSVAAGAFFTILYAFEWGKQKSTEWLVTFILSFFQSVLIVQPIKVIAVAVLLTFLFKKDSDTQDYEDKLGKMEERSDNLTPANKDILSSTMHLSHEEIMDAKKRKLADKKMNAMIKEIVWQTFFLLLLLFVVIGNQDSNVFRQNQDLRNALLGNIQMQTRNELWTWFQDELLPSLYYTEDYNLNPVKSYDERFISNTYAMRLGPPRIRQLRIKIENCSVPAIVHGYVNHCTKDYSETVEDRKTYSRKWAREINNTEAEQHTNELDKAFHYVSPKEMDGIKYWGKFEWYPSGGYVLNLGNKQDQAESMLQQLQTENWIDRYTRVVFVEFNVWNANTNLFNMFILSFELLPFGGIVTWNTIDTVHLYRYAGPGGLLNLLAELILVIFVVVFTIIIIVKAVKSKCDSFVNFWTILEVVSLVIFYAGMGMYAWRSVLTASTIEKMMNNKGQLINFQLLVLTNTVFMNLLSIMTFLVMMRLVHILRYNKTISIMGSTIAKSSVYLFGMFVTFGIIFVGFTALCYTLFGTKMLEYSTVLSTMSALSEAFLGKFDFQTVTEANGIIGGFILFAYLLIMMLLIMNLFVSIFNEFLAAVQEDPDSQPKDHEVVEHFVDVLKSFLPSSEKKKGVHSTENKDQESTSHEKLSIDSVNNLCQHLDKIPQTIDNSHHISHMMQNFIQDYYNWKSRHLGMTQEDFLIDKAHEASTDTETDEIIMLAFQKFYQTKHKKSFKH